MTTQTPDAVREALTSCRDQFAFYAREHTAAGKSEKAATNARFAKIADDALAALDSRAGDAGEGMSGILSRFPNGWKVRQVQFSAPCADDRKWHVNVYGGKEGRDAFVGRGATAELALLDAAAQANPMPATPAPAVDAVPAGMRIEDGRPISEAPYACHVLAGRLDHDAGEWIMAVVSSPPIYPFTHWWPLPGMIAALSHGEGRK